MAGGTPDKGSVNVRRLAIRCPTEEGQPERLPLSPVTNNVPATGSPGKKYAHGSPLRKTTFRESYQNQAALYEGGTHASSQEPTEGATGLCPTNIPPSDAADSRSSPCRHAFFGSALSTGK